MSFIVFDKQIMNSVRRYSEDGHLHIASTPISKSNICEYYGHEIPNHNVLGLDKDKIYRLFRDPKELEKAAYSFNRIPVLRGHAIVTGDDPQKERWIGTTGESSRFEKPYLLNSMSIWDGEAIKHIESEEERELSCAYAYTPDMTPGTYEGAQYDGRMTKIRGNHVALVPKGRAGPDVMVMDSALNADNKKEKYMDEDEKIRAQERAAEALLESMNDKSPDEVRICLALCGLVEAARNVLSRRESSGAQDATIRHTQADLFGGESTNTISGGHGRGGWNHDSDAMKSFEAELRDNKEKEKTIEAARKIFDKEGDLDKKLSSFENYLREDGRSDEDRKALVSKARSAFSENKAKDENEESEEKDEKKAMKNEEKAEDGDTELNAFSSELGKSGISEEKAKEIRALAKKIFCGAETKEGGNASKAQDGALMIERRIQLALDAERARTREIDLARSDVMPLIGPMAFDSAKTAEEIYRYALTSSGTHKSDLEGVNLAGLRSMVMFQTRSETNARPMHAQDSARNYPILVKKI